MSEFREARLEDLPHLVALLMDDPLGKGREDLSNMVPYEEAFAAIERDPNQQMLLMVDGDTLLGCVQISYLPGLSYRGAWTAQLEGVRIRSDRRSEGLGKRLIEKALELAQKRDCKLVQLASSRGRVQAIAFYEQLGFENSHAGMKRCLTPQKMNFP